MASAADISKIVANLQTVAPAGFAMAFHIRFTTPSFLLQSYPANWIAHYSQQGMVMSDPTVHWGFENTGLIDWSYLIDRDTVGVISQAAEYGMKFGLTYAANRSDSLTVSSFARSDRNFNAQERTDIENGVNAIHDATMTSGTLPKESVETLKKMSITATLS